MNITFDKKHAVHVFSKFSNVCDKKSTMPILQCVLIQTRPVGDIYDTRVSGTDLFMSLDTSLKSDVDGPGSVAIPFKDLLERLRAMPDGQVELSADNSGATLTSGKRKFKLRTMPGHDYPMIPTPTGDVYQVPSSALSDLISHTSYSIARDELRANLNSALLTVESGTARMVTTDGHRLTVREIELADNNFDMMIPLRALSDIASLSGPLSVHKSNANIFFSDGVTHLSFKIADAQFPPWKQVIPKPSYSLNVNRKNLLDSLRAISVAANERTGTVNFKLNGDVLTLAVDDASDELVIMYDGPELTIGLNAKYVMESLSVLSDEHVSIGVTGHLDPVMVRRDGYSAVIMPVRL